VGWAGWWIQRYALRLGTLDLACLSIHQHQLTAGFVLFHHHKSWVLLLTEV